MGELSIVLNPEQRKQHINKLLALDNLSHIEENEKMAYCPISCVSEKQCFSETQKIAKQFFRVFLVRA